MATQGSNSLRGRAEQRIKLALVEEQRAQASAPFELFVAVIIMAFVMIVGYQVLQQVQNEVCLNSVEREMTTFKLNLEDTVQRRSSKAFAFNPSGSCFDSKETILNVKFVSDKRVCADRCGYPSDGCYLMTFQNYKVANAFKQKCLDLPPYTTFKLGSDCDTGTNELSGYNAIDPTKESKLHLGLYATKNMSSAGETYPKICLFYKG